MLSNKTRDCCASSIVTSRLSVHSILPCEPTNALLGWLPQRVWIKLLDIAEAVSLLLPCKLLLLMLQIRSRNYPVRRGEHAIQAGVWERTHHGRLRDIHVRLAYHTLVGASGVGNLLLRGNILRKGHRILLMCRAETFRECSAGKALLLLR